jgi:hypothetical protein
MAYFSSEIVEFRNMKLHVFIRMYDYGLELSCDDSRLFVYQGIMDISSDPHSMGVLGGLTQHGREFETILRQYLVNGQAYANLNLQDFIDKLGCRDVQHVD